MNKKVLFICIVLCISFLISGCWNSMELNTLGISLVIGLDIEENGEILLTAEIIKPMPSKKSSEGNIVKYVQGRGQTIFEAARDITLKFDRRLFASHTKVFIFGEEFAKKGMLKYMDFLQRDHELRETAYLLVAKDTKAYEVMGITAGIDDIPANYILQIIKNEKLNSKEVDLNISGFLKYYYAQGLQPVIGVIEKKEKKKVGKDSGSKREKDYELSLEGAAIFKKEKLVGYLNGLETRGFNFLNDEIKGGLIEFPTPKGKNGNFSKTPMKQNKSIVEIIRSKTKKDIEIRDGKVVLKTKITMKGMLGEVIGNIDISKEENIKAFEKACSIEIKKEIEDVIKKAQEKYKVDVFSFSPIFHKKYPKEWHKIKTDWDEIFSEAELEIEVNTDILRTGLINTPTGDIKGE